VQLTTIPCSGGMQNLTANVATASGTIDKTMIARIGIQVGGGNSSSWSTPNTVVYVNSITVSGAAIGPYNFDAASSISQTIMGTNVMFLSNDSPAPGSAVSWLGP
jgi:hypothetical protein